MTILITLLVFCSVFGYALFCAKLIEDLATRWHQRKLWRNVVRRITEDS